MHLYGSQGPWLQIMSSWISLLQDAIHHLERVHVHAVPFIYINGAQEARRAWTKSNCLLCCNECLWVACLHSAVGQYKLLQNVAWCCNDSPMPGPFWILHDCSIWKETCYRDRQWGRNAQLCQSWWILRFAKRIGKDLLSVPVCAESNWNRRASQWQGTTFLFNELQGRGFTWLG